jgi:hypothetical protein
VRRFGRRAGLASVVPRAGVASFPRAPNFDDALYTARSLRVTVRRQDVLRRRRTDLQTQWEQMVQKVEHVSDEDLSGRTKRRCGSASRCDRATARRQVHVDRDVWEKSVLDSSPTESIRIEPATRIISWSSLFDMRHRDSRGSARRFERFHRVEAPDRGRTRVGRRPRVHNIT